jgi:hypothetical protein
MCSMVWDELGNIWVNASLMTGAVDTSSPFVQNVS